jgi:hypothetical protein
MSGQTELICPLCEREVPRVTAHHIVPKSRSGRKTIGICPDCHGMIHALFLNRELERDLSLIDELKSQPEFATWLKWIGRRPADRRYRPRRSRQSRNRGRGG